MARRHSENFPQVTNCLAPANRQEGDSLPGIISRTKERKALDMVPVKMRERDKDLVLFVADGAKISSQISQSCARVNDGDAVRIGERFMRPSNRRAKSQWHDGFVWSAVVWLSYRLSAAVSWNCNVVFGLTTVVPAVCPCCACRAVCGGPAG